MKKRQNICKYISKQQQLYKHTH